MKLIGIDDAGRGPVLGPMILAGILIEESEEPILKELGAKDSKLLLPPKRKILGDKFKKDYSYHIESSTPAEIDESSNLNDLEAIKAAKIINKLAKETDEKIQVIIDCPSVNLETWGDFVKKLVEDKERITVKVEHKADFNHPVVSAASIIAKERREEEMENLRAELGLDFGSGYPADPKTKEFIKKNYNNAEYSNIIRHSWATVKKLKKEKNQKSLF
ncbi:ribonuclease HII [archaeon]|nr:ribonuclease HII [archaeon]